MSRNTHTRTLPANGQLTPTRYADYMMDEMAADKNLWQFTTEGSQTMARTTYFKASMILVALVTVLLVVQKPVAAGVVISDGLCFPPYCPPETTITYGPSGNVSEYYVLDRASFEFRGTSYNQGLRFECRLDGSPWSACSSPIEYSDLSEGSHTFEVRAIDSRSMDYSPASRTWTVDTTKPPPSDTTPPETRLTSYPTEPSPTVSFGFTGRDAFGGTAVDDLTFECRLDGGEWETSCTSPKGYPPLSDGTHTFQVRATDSSNNTDPTPETRQFRVDTTPPDTIITSKPSDPSGATPTFGFYGRDDVSNILYFMCRYSLSGSEGNWTSCTSPRTLPEIFTSGTYTFEVYAVDGWGRPDPTPASYTWTVDTSTPSAPIITSPPDNSVDTDGSFIVSGTAENGSTVRLFEGAASRGTAEVGSSGEWSIELTGVPDGSHSYTARATDAAGNASVESDARSVTVDATAPGTPSIGSPAEDSFDNDGSFIVSGSGEPNSTVELSEITAGGTVSLGTATADSAGNWNIVVASVTEGPHSYTARATDAAGHVSADSDARTVMVDSTRPTVETSSPVNRATAVARSVNIMVTFSDEMAPASLTTSAKLYQWNALKKVWQPVPVRASVSGKTASLDPYPRDPKRLLAVNTKFKVTIPASAMNLAGLSMSSARSWTFTTK